MRLRALGLRDQSSPLADGKIATPMRSLREQTNLGNDIPHEVGEYLPQLHNAVWLHHLDISARNYLEGLVEKKLWPKP